MKLIIKGLVLIIGVFIIFSGCISEQKKIGINPIITQQSSIPITTLSSGNQYWIQIDPITDYNTDSTLNIIGSSQLVVSGTTNFPIGTQLHFLILEENRERDVLRTTLEVMNNNSGPNSFSYGYDMKGNPPGHYRVLLDDSTHLYSAISRFNITAFDKTDIPSSKWIRMDPIVGAQEGMNIHVSGTTDLPAGAEIIISYSMLMHSCTPSPTPDIGGQRTFCGGSCRSGDVSSHSIEVVEGAGGINSWNSTVNTSTWCKEIYSIGAEASSFPNVTPVSQYIRLSSIPP